MMDMTSEQIVEWTKTKVNQNCDGVFISCTCFRGMGAAEQLEKDLGIPVVQAIRQRFGTCCNFQDTGLP